MTPAEVTTILRQFNGWRRDFDDKFEQPDPHEVSEAIDAAVEMIERLESSEKERANANAAAVNIALEAERLQCEIDNLRAKIEAAEKSDAESLAMYRKAMDERDALRAALRHEADCVEACKSEIERLRAKLEATEEDRSRFLVEIGRLCAQCDALRARIEEMENQEPVRLVTAVAYRWRYRGAIKWQYGELTEETVRLAKEHNHEVQSLYALPGAQGEEK